MNIANKRKAATAGDNPKRLRRECDYGERCYRRNPAHFREFKHKHLESILDEYSGCGDYPIPDKYILERLTIMEQLDVIVEKELYTPWKNKTQQMQPSSSNTLTPKVESTKTSETTNKNVKTPTNQSNEKNRAEMNATSNNTGPSSMLSSNGNDGTNSKNDGTSSKNDASGSNDFNMNRNIEENKPFILDYTLARDYRPIVPPTRRVEDYLNVIRPRHRMADKHDASAPYYIFYTTITAAKETHSQQNSITFQEILDPSLGELKCSLQINFMVELGWLLAQYYFAGYSEKKMTILYGEENHDLRTITEKKPHIDAHKISLPTPFGSHHTKMMLLCYENGSIRVVISTANLYLDDWENRTQGLWFSPACKPLPPQSPPQQGESPTGFKRSLLQYLHNYRLPALASYVETVKNCDFSHINVFLCASVPGSHEGREWGLARVGSLLRQHCAGARWPLIAQASSIGSYGAQPQLWLTGDFLHNLTKVKDQPKVLTAPPELKLIYPSLDNVSQSHDGLLGGGCLPYLACVHSRQPWLTDFLYQWKATASARDKAMPHIKSYTRVSTDNKMASYYLLTSANCSKAAWGSFNKGNGALRIMSYEVGVLLLPQFVIKKDYFPLEGENRLVLAYDVPPIKYTPDMIPWLMDNLSMV